MPLGRTWQVVAGSATVGLLVAAGVIAAAGPWDSGQRTAERAYAVTRDQQADRAARPVPVRAAAPEPPAAAPVLLPAAAGPAAGPVPSARLDALMAAPGMGPIRTGAVVDVATGQLLYGHGATTATTPASTTKLATAIAALATLGGDHRLSTTVVTTSPGAIVLVGGGDPTLVLDKLADDTAAALKAAGTTTVRLGYDASFFAGPALHPIGYNENLAPVTGLMAREGRLDHSSSGPAQRSEAPAAAAASSFATLLGKRGVTVAGTTRPASGAGGAQIAVHRSAALSDLVEQMLTESDNDLAEALARQTAHATGLPTTFAGGAKAISTVLARFGVPLGGAVFADGSGLDHRDKLAPLTEARLLTLAASPDHPELRPVVTGLPIAAFTGTLGSRFRSSPAAGLLHAKTGTLTGTNTVAGTAVTPGGRLLAFSFMTQKTLDPPAAEAALDRLAAALVQP